MNSTVRNEQELEAVERRQKVEQFINEQYEKTKQQITQRQMTIVDKNRIKEQESQLRIGIKKEEKMRIEKNKELRQQIIDNDPDRTGIGMTQDEGTLGDDDKKNDKMAALNQTRTTTLSKDSVSNNVGNLGKLIARFIEDREKNP